METENKNTTTTDHRGQNKAASWNNSGRIMGGLIIVTIGVLLLAREAGVVIPRWLLSFETILIALGLYLGVRHSFRGFGWLVPILIGTFLLLDDLFPFYDVREFFWPVVIIGVGLFIMFRPGKKSRDWTRRESSHPTGETSAEDYLDSTVVFGGIKKNIISKNFRGGETVTVFGGTEVNLTQADISGVVVLELTQIFGGTKLIVPSHWKVHTKELVAILGGVDDKRPMITAPTNDDTQKVLILKGTCLLGGIDIRSY